MRPPCPIVEFLAAEEGLAERLLAEHVDEGDGRCRVCTSGAQTGRPLWPCRTHDYAARAVEVARGSGVDLPRAT